MAIHFAKAERPRAIPLTPEEQALARELFRAIKKATDKISIKDLERLTSRLDPAQLNRLIASISIANQKELRTALLNAIDIGGNEAIKELQEMAPKLSLPAAALATIPTSDKPLADMDFGKPFKTPTSRRGGKVTVTTSFNVTNPNSLRFAETRAAQLITSIDALTRDAIKQTIIEAFREQIDVRATAKRIKNVVGLHPQWAKAVTEFEKKELARLIRQGDKPERALVKAQERASRYADSLKSKRATMIARTEIQIAQNEGREEGWRQAAEEGFIAPESMRRWVTAQDERTCDECAPMDGEEVPWDGVFSNGLTNPIVHPNCRCAVILIPPERGR